MGESRSNGGKRRRADTRKSTRGYWSLEEALPNMSTTMAEDANALRVTSVRTYVFLSKHRIESHQTCFEYGISRVHMSNERRLAKTVYSRGGACPALENHLKSAPMGLVSALERLSSTNHLLHPLYSTQFCVYNSKEKSELSTYVSVRYVHRFKRTSMRRNFIYDHTDRFGIRC
jgi:hypothetical protein